MIKEAEEHISLVQVEWSYYCSILKEYGENFKKTFGVPQVPSPNSKIPAMTNRITIHCSFDMA